MESYHYCMRLPRVDVRHCSEHANHWQRQPQSAQHEVPQTELVGESLPISAADSLTTGLPSELKVICEGGLEALAFKLRTRALSEKAHNGPSL